LKGTNTIKLASTTAEGLSNIDQIGYVSAGLAKGSCVITGIEETEESQNCSVYPNPFTSNITIVANGAFTFSVLDVTGKVLEKGEANNEAKVCENLSSGLYMIQINQNQLSKTFSVIKK